jgi:hypothetical protein
MTQKTQPQQPQRIVATAPETEQELEQDSGPVQIELAEEFTYNGAHYGPGLVEAPNQATADALVRAQGRLNKNRMRTPVVTVHGVVSGIHPNTVAPGVLVPADVENRVTYAQDQMQVVNQKAEEARKAAAEAGASDEEQQAAADQARAAAEEEARAGGAGAEEGEGEGGESEGAVALREGLSHQQPSRELPPTPPPPKARTRTRPQPPQQ